MHWTVQPLMELATGYWRSAALSAAVELGVFEALDAAPRSAADLAATLGMAPRHLEELLHALVALELLVEQEGRFAIEPSAAVFLAPSGAACMLDALRFNMDLYPLWGRLAQSVREGRPALPPGAHLGMDPARTRRFAMGMHSRALSLAPALLSALPIPEGGSLLDVGAGPGTFSRLLAEQRKNLYVTQFDLPPVLAVAEELAAASPAVDRVAFAPGDYRRDALPEGFDVVLYCGALHQEDDDTARALFDKCRRALKPGGRFVVVDLMVEAGRNGPAFPALFSVTMMLTSPFGRVFEAPRVEALLGELGFAPVRATRLESIPYWIVSGDRTR